jgi:DnaK suppressor protein
MDAEQLRHALNARSATLLGREAALQRHLRGQDGRNEADFSDRVAFTEMDEVLEGLDDAARLELDQIHAQIDRLDRGVWQDCASCGEPIGEARLAAIPHTTRCVRCAG